MKRRKSWLSLGALALSFSLLLSLFPQTGVRAEVPGQDEPALGASVPELSQPETAKSELSTPSTQIVPPQQGTELVLDFSEAQEAIRQTIQRFEERKAQAKPQPRRRRRSAEPIPTGTGTEQGAFGVRLFLKAKPESKAVFERYFEQLGKRELEVTVTWHEQVSQGNYKTEAAGSQKVVLSGEAIDHFMSEAQDNRGANLGDYHLYPGDDYKNNESYGFRLHFSTVENLGPFYGGGHDLQFSGIVRFQPGDGAPEEIGGYFAKELPLKATFNQELKIQYKRRMAGENPVTTIPFEDEKLQITLYYSENGTGPWEPWKKEDSMAFLREPTEFEEDEIAGDDQLYKDVSANAYTDIHSLYSPKQGSFLDPSILPHLRLHIGPAPYDPDADKVVTLDDGTTYKYEITGAPHEPGNPFQIQVWEKVKTVFKNPASQEFGIVRAATGDTSAEETDSSVTVSGFYGDPIQTPTVEMKTDETSAAYSFVRWTPADSKAESKPNLFDDVAEYLAVYKKKVVEVVEPNPGENPDDKDYIRVTFDAQAGKGYFGESLEQGKQLLVLDILKGTAKADVLPHLEGLHAQTGFTLKPENERWKPELPETFDANGTYTAQYTVEDAISPEPKPGYVKITFSPDGNSSLAAPEYEADDELFGKLVEEGKNFITYVNPRAGLTLDDLPQPLIQPNVGYQVADPKWSQEPEAKTLTQATTFTAQVEKMADVIPAQDKDGNPLDPEGQPVTPEKGNEPVDLPNGYIIVVFNPGNEGVITEGNKMFYVNPLANKTLADLPAPTLGSTVEDKVPANPSWKLVSASSADSEDLITDEEELKKLGETLTQNRTYEGVIVPSIQEVTPKDPGEPFNPDQPEDPNNSQKTPTDFIRVIFNSGEGSFKVGPGEIQLKQKAYDIHKSVLFEKVRALDPKAELEPKKDRTFSHWDQDFATKDDKATLESLAGAGPLTFTAQYQDTVQVVTPKEPEKPFEPENPDGENNSQKTPEGFIRLIFDAAAGSFGKYTDTTTPIKKTAYDVHESVVWNLLKDKVPTLIEPPSLLRFKDWSPSLPTQDEAETSIKDLAQGQNHYVFTALYEDNDAQVGKETPDYLKITFRKPEHGTLSLPKDQEELFQVEGDEIHTWIQPSKLRFNQVITPVLTPDEDYRNLKPEWTLVSPSLSQEEAEGLIKEDRVYTGAVEPLPDWSVEPIPNFFKLVFQPGANGSLSPKTIEVEGKQVSVGKMEEKNVVVWVHPTRGIQLSTLTPNVAPAAGWVHHPDAPWNYVSGEPKVEYAPTAPVTGNWTYEANYLSTLIEIQPKDPNQPFKPEEPGDENNDKTKPTGFLRVIFDAGEGSFGTYENSEAPIKKTAYDVAPNQTWSLIEAKVPVAVPPTDKVFKGWLPVLPQSGDAIQEATYVAQYQDNVQVVTPVDPEKPFEPEKPDGENNSQKTPEDFVRIIFDAGEGSFGTYPNTTTPIRKIAVDVHKGTPWEKVAPFVPADASVVAPDSKSYVGWKPELPSNETEIQAPATYLASYLDSILPVTPVDPTKPFVPENPEDGNNSQKTPKDYVRVIFRAEEGQFRTEQGLRKTLAFDVHKDKTWKDLLPFVPTEAEIEAPLFSSFAGEWDPALPAETETVVAGEYKAQYVRLIIPVDPKDPSKPFKPEEPGDGNNSHETPDGYVRVIFDATEGDFGNYWNGELIRKVAFDVRKGTPWNLLLRVLPKANPPFNMEFKTWDPTLPDLTANPNATVEEGGIFRAVWYNPWEENPYFPPLVPGGGGETTDKGDPTKGQGLETQPGKDAVPKTGEAAPWSLALLLTGVVVLAAYGKRRGWLQEEA